jgi:hypothetical protein
MVNKCFFGSQGYLQKWMPPEYCWYYVMDKQTYQEDLTTKHFHATSNSQYKDQESTR